MSSLAKFDHIFITFAKNHYALIARIALFVIYFYFGLLKIIGLSPANDLAIGFAEKMGFGFIAHELFILLAIVECLIGIMILFPRLTRVAILVMLLHMILVCSPIVLYPEATWSAPFVPNLEGQYIIKNAALVALALGLVASTKPIKSTKRLTNK